MITSLFRHWLLKVQTDPHMGKLVYFRVYSGSVKAGLDVLNMTKDKKERLGRILQMHANQRENRDDVYAGEIAAGVGLETTITGDTLCDPDHPVVLEAIEFPTPVISISVAPQSRADQDKLTKGLLKLAEEDPTFKVHTDVETDEMIISGMGELHLEIIVDRLKEEFGVEATVGKPGVAYKETILEAKEQEYKHIKQSGGRGQYGHVVFELSPSAPGKGFEFVNKVVGGRIPEEYIPAVEKGMVEALLKGAYAGYPVVDVTVTLTDGFYHDVDSSEIAFKIAAMEGFKEAFRACSPILLEPHMSVEVTTPEDYVGPIVGDLCSRRGKVLGMESKGGQHIINAEAPLSEMFGYSTHVTFFIQRPGKLFYAF